MIVVRCLRWPNSRQNYAVRDTSSSDEEDTILHFHRRTPLMTRNVKGVAIPIKRVAESIRGIIGVVRANYNTAIMYQCAISL